MEAFICPLLVLWGSCAILGAIAGKDREASDVGMLLGLIFGPLGLIATLGIDGRKCCPECRGRVPSGAKVCRSCRIPLAWRDGAVMTEPQAEIIDAAIQRAAASLRGTPPD